MVLSPDTGGGSTLGFVKTLDAVREDDTPWVRVQRRSDVQGAVTVDVLTERPDGTTVQETLSWPDGDGADRSILVLFLQLPAGSGARTARFTLLNPTGGASIDPLRGTMAVAVVPREWGAPIEALFVRLWALLGSFSSTWLIVLSLPAAALAVRGARARRA